MNFSSFAVPDVGVVAAPELGLKSAVGCFYRLWVVMFHMKHLASAGLPPVFRSPHFLANNVSHETWHMKFLRHRAAFVKKQQARVKWWQRTSGIVTLSCVT
ncbi:MAG: hypothetical protein HDQ92_05605 [Desulfovibrio sp.]|nr:hypothetical protein [Desulfovibrio sp.]